MRDGWLSWPCWLTDSGRLNHKVVTHPASSLAQDRESSPAKTSVLTTMLCRLDESVRHRPHGEANTSKRLDSLPFVVADDRFWIHMTAELTVGGQRVICLYAGFPMSACVPSEDRGTRALSCTRLHCDCPLRFHQLSSCQTVIHNARRAENRRCSAQPYHCPSQSH